MYARKDILAISALIPLFLTELTVSQAQASQAVSCGKVRWSVKTGTDADSHLVVLNHTEPISIAELASLPAPNTRPSNHRIAPTETTVYKVRATVTKILHEKDSDYHLALESQDGKKMVAESPDPKCVGSTSPFLSDIAKAREKLMTRMAEAKTDPSKAIIGHVACITGVGFFDFIHTQKGRAPNAIELHPILAIDFDGANCSSAPPTTTETIIGNPGFENGTNHPGPWTVTDQVIMQNPGEPPHSGSWDAWLSGYGFANTSEITQQITIPDAATSARLIFWLHIDTAEATSTGKNDVMTVAVYDPDGTLLKKLATYSNLNARSGYHRHRLTVSQFIGKTIILKFTGVENASRRTSFVVDDVSIKLKQ